MISTLKMQENMAFIMLLGTLTAIVLVAMGGLIYLWSHGLELMHINLIESSHYKIDIRTLKFSLSPLFLIELGLLVLVATQILRVLVLAVYYSSIRDYKFTFISLFVLIVLLFTFIAQK